MPNTFLSRWDDPALTTPENWDTTTYIENHKVRIIANAALAFFASEVPRRLTDATPAELAADKRLSRKTCARLKTSLISWGGQPADVEELIQLRPTKLQRQGVQVIWPNWWSEHKAQLQKELTFAATTAIRTGRLKDGNRFCNRMLNELNMLGQIHEPRALYR